MDEQLRQEVQAMIDEAIRKHIHSGTDSLKVKLRDLDFPKQSAISDPNGGATQDAQARNAIEAIIDTLETLNLIETN